jgi:large repetitive protein
LNAARVSQRNKGFAMVGQKFGRAIWVMLVVLTLFRGTVASAADIQVSSYSSAPDPIPASAEATFTVTVANNSTPAVNNAVVTMTIPSNFEVINAPSNFPSFCILSGTVGSQTLTCSIPPLLGGGASRAQTFTFKATARTPGAISSTASISASGNSDANPNNDSVTFTPTVRGGADLTISKTGSAPNVIAGGNLTYSLTVTNNGPNATSAVRVVDNLPASSDFQFTSVSANGWSCSQSGTQVTCNFTGTAPTVGTPFPAINILGKVTKATAGTISNIASVTGTDPLILDPNGLNNNSNTVVTTVNAGSDLQAIKSMPSTITVGSPANVVLTIRNTGPQNAPAGSTIVDVFDASLTIGALPSGCSQSGQTVTCTAGALNATQQVNFTVPVTGASATGAIINNSATVAPPPGFADPDLANNSAIAPFQVVLPNADLELRSKTKTPNPVAPGANITSTIVVRNLGPSIASYTPANPLRVTDTLSADESYVSVSGAWSCTVSGLVVTCATTDTGTIAVNAQKTLTLITQAGPGVDANVTNSACTDRTANSGHTPSSAASPTGNDCRSAGVRSTTRAADLSVAKDVSLSSTGGWTENLAISDTDTEFYIRLRVSNAVASDTARTVSVTDALPNFINSGAFVTGVVQQSSTSGSFSYTATNGLATWSLSNLAGGATETLIIRVTRPFESGSFTNFASVFSPDTTELSSANNTDSAAYSVTGIADMTINSKSVTPNPARVGVPSTYIISVRNDGANPADNVVVTDVIDPTRFEIIGTPTTTKPGGSCSVTVATGTISCALGTFTRTEVRQINIIVLPKYPFGTETLASLPAPHTNQATVTTSTRDANGGSNPVAGNNFFNLNHNMQAPTYDLTVSKAESDPANDDPIRFDETLNYDVRVSNLGPSRATDIVLTDIPAPPAGLTMTLSSVTINPVAANGGLTLQAAPNAGCSPSGATIICRIDTSSTANNFLDSQKQVIFRMRFAIGGTPPSSVVTFSNAAELTSAEQPVWNGAGADVQTANNRAVQNTTVRPSTDLEVISKTRVGAVQRSVNEPVEYVIRFRNNGPSSAAKVRITDVLPSGFVYAATPAPSALIPSGSSATVSAVTCSGTSTIICDIMGNFPVGAGNSVDLSVYAKALAPYSGALSPTDVTNTATITPGLDAGGEPLSEDADGNNNSQSAVTQVRASSIAGTVYADNNDSNTIDSGEGMNGVTLTLTGTDAFNNPVSFTTTTNSSGQYSFDRLPPSGPGGYSIVETQVATHYDLNETAGTLSGTVNNGAYGNTAAENTISAIVLAASTDGTGYIFQNHLKAVIVATNNAPPSVNGATGQANIVNAYDNDSFNGAAIDTTKIVGTIVTPASNAGVTMDPATGLVSVAAGTPAGTYTIDYRICDKADLTTCATARVTVVVTAAPIASTNDTIGGINGATGAPNVLSALTGDTLNGVAATTANVTIALAPAATVPAGLTFDTATGNTLVNANTPAGTYSFNYQICERLNPANCSISTETVTVVAGPIVAVNDSATGINGATGAANVLNVLTGDTRNASAATTGNVTVSLAPAATVPAGLSFDTATGNVSVNPGTPAGTYFFNYRICEQLNPSNCAIAEARVTVVAAPIVAVNESVAGINGATGAANVLNALDGDTLNGVAATTSTVTIALAPAATVPAGLSFDTATGDTSVAAGTAAGVYSFDYQICERLNPANCAIARETVTVVPAPIDAISDSISGINGASGATNVLNVLGADTLNGTSATTARVTIAGAATSSVPAGLTFDPATGNISVSPGTAAGPYSFDYSICERLNPTNCDTATATVTVIAAPMAAVNDSIGGINGFVGSTNALNVLASDTLNGAPATASTVTIAVASGSALPAGLAFDPATGIVGVTPGTPAGAYSFNYTICERLNPSNCRTATATVTVVAAPITADDENAAPVNGASGATGVIDAIVGDTLNNAQALLSDLTVSVVTPATPVGSNPVPFLNVTTGLVDVPAGTPAGRYVIGYRICEAINPTNCANATITAPVLAAPITAVNDSIGNVNGASGVTNVLNALVGDTLDGAAATLASMSIALAPGATVPAGLTFDPATGNTSVNPGTAAGIYSFDYQICERLNPSNCAIATETVSVVPPPIDANDDSASGINGASGAANVLNVLTADVLNGAPATTGTATISVAAGSTVPTGLSFDPVTGNVSVTPGTSAGNYSFDYTICERLNPSNCATATATVTVVPAPIDANDDSVSGINGAFGANDVLGALAGDTLNGAPATLATVTIALAPGATVPAGLSFDPETGNTSVNAGTPAGSYSFDYRICERLNPTNCVNATETVTVIAAPIVAVNDSATGINGASGATNVLNALAGDTLNGAPATLATVSIALAPSATVPVGLNFDPATGNTSVNRGTAAGSYSFDYQICERLNPTNCAIATATVTVVAAPISATPDASAPTNGATGAADVINVLPNDVLNGTPVTPTTVAITVITPATQIGSAPVPTLDPATGSVSVPAGTPAGSYTIDYQICERLNPSNCGTTTVTVPVTAGPIAAVNDSATGINGASGAANVLNVLTGDTVNGVAATVANVTITLAPGATVPAGLSFDPATGNVSVNPGTAAGTYSFGYQICEILNPTNCTTATATVTVVPAPIVAINDRVDAVDATNGAPNVLNAFTGDTINGQPATPANAIVSLASGVTLPAGFSFDPATGNVSLAAGTADGTYSFNYQLCERLNPTNCAIATMTVVVAPARSTLSGIVYLDANLNRSRDGGEPLQEGWLVEVIRNGVVIDTARTDAQGAYAVPNLLSGGGYTIQFRHPVSNAVYGRIESATLPVGGNLADQNLPIDPSGVVYDAITRAPVAGARVSLLDANGAPLPISCYLDPSQAGQVTGSDGYYRFDIVAGAAAQCPTSRTEYRLQVSAPTGYADPESTVIAAQNGALNVAGLGNPAAVVPGARAPRAGDPTTYYLAFWIASGDAHVVNNHIPLDPFLTRAPLLVTKTSEKRTASTGDLVPYTITVRNSEAAARASVTVVDILPPGFKYVPGSARVDGVAQEPAVIDRELRWTGQRLADNATATYQIVAVIGAGVTEGDRINTAVARNPLTGGDISNRAQAVVSIVPSAIFDCAEVIGKVFDDLDGDGYQDEGEPGIPAARIATVNGQLITADEYGRYHITCAAVPNGQIGSNFVLKLDTRTIPAGYAPTSDNPQSIRLTRGKMSELNFGVQRARLVSIAVDARAFIGGGADLKPAMVGELAQLTKIDAQKLVIQLNYAASPTETDAAIEARLATLREQIVHIFKSNWDGPPPVIEANMVRAATAAGRE